ncbi:uncharacterized protein LOC107267492 [Cephus cinctus]|uniref:Uncharacterized protein LOC107267492 n=1 Tax=Cephus cinctus TaxID=211228 RepID=A0AAJ7FJE8_CEPCN|nr:uncharacterized protein LOC107267492 [Cephus cinctus]
MYVNVKADEKKVVGNSVSRKVESKYSGKSAVSQNITRVKNTDEISSINTIDSKMKCTWNSGERVCQTSEKLKVHERSSSMEKTCTIKNSPCSPLKSLGWSRDMCRGSGDRRQSGECKENIESCDRLGAKMSSQKFVLNSPGIFHKNLVKIQVENCLQVTEKTNPSSSGGTSRKDSNCEEFQPKANALVSMANYNSIETAAEVERDKSSKKYSGKTTTIVQTTSKGKKSTENTTSTKFLDSAKKYLWSSAKSSKSQSSSNKDIDRSRLQEHSTAMEKVLKVKKSGCSPLKKLSRSSLSIEPDKITINLSKYSPCASRLAASSKILSSSSTTSPESPLRVVKSRSPSRVENQVLELDDRSVEMTLRASLSLNIQHCPKSTAAPRSKSVGDSCITSPTSEETTMSYSPTGTEILSLEEVVAQPRRPPKRSDSARGRTPKRSRSIPTRMEKPPRRSSDNSQGELSHENLTDYFLNGLRSTTEDFSSDVVPVRLYIPHF